MYAEPWLMTLLLRWISGYWYQMKTQQRWKHLDVHQCQWPSNGPRIDLRDES